jgi:hypothetical protein
MEVKGKVVQLLPLQTGTGKKGAWKKQEFILETQSQYPKKVCLSIWGDKIDQYSLQPGDDITVAVDLESREYNGRWYTEARAWKIDKTGSGSSMDSRMEVPPPTQESFISTDSSQDDLPF